MLLIQLLHGNVAAHWQKSTIVDNSIAMLLPLSLTENRKKPSNDVFLGCFPSQIKLLTLAVSVFTRLLTTY